jgi:hypothetical protein
MKQVVVVENILAKKKFVIVAMSILVVKIAAAVAANILILRQVVVADVAVEKNTRVVLGSLHLAVCSF